MRRLLPLTLLILPFLLALACPGLARAEDDAALAAQLRAASQAMLDAVAVGDKSVWERYTDPALIYVTEGNEVLGRDELISQLSPLPPGLKGRIEVVDHRLERHGDFAVATHLDQERLDYHGQRIETRFRTTESWARGEDGQWRIVAAKVMAVLDDPPAIALSEQQLDAYVGVYTLTGDIAYEVRRDGTRLFGRRTGRDEEELLAEAPDLFFVPGRPRSRKVFRRSAGDAIEGFADRREGHDIWWARRP